MYRLKRWQENKRGYGKKRGDGILSQGHKTDKLLGVEEGVLN